MTAPALPHQLDRTMLIRATPDIVFGFFTDSARWAQWWGAGSTIDARVGGAVLIRHPDGTEVVGDVVEVRVPERIVFTYGYSNGKLVAPKGSLVTIRLEPVGVGTRLHLKHQFAEATARDHHVQGWRYQLSLFANLVADYTNRDVATLVDAWFDVWAESDATVREQTLKRIADSGLAFHDRFGNTDGVDDLLPHIAAAQQFMPGFRMRRSADVRHCQGIVLADWTAAGPDGVERGRGTNVFVLDPTGRIESVTGFWASA